MSKQAKYNVKLKNVDAEVLDMAVRRMAKELKLKVIDKSHFRIYNLQSIPIEGTCVRLPYASYPVDIYADGDNIVFNGDEADQLDYRKYEDQVKQFYEGMVIGREFGIEPEYDKESEQLKLVLEV